MTAAIRFLVAGVAALALTGGMFSLLRALVTSDEGPPVLKQAVRIEFSRLRRDSQVESRRDEKPTLKEAGPTPQATTAMNLGKGAAMAAPVSVAPTQMGGVQANVGMKKMIVKTGGSDRDVVPLVRIEPDYPPRALEKGIEGWVIVRFTITTIGTVKDAVVVEASPPKVFDDAAVKAVLRWKYNPKIEEGTAVERRGVQVLLRFDMNKDA